MADEMADEIKDEILDTQSFLKFVNLFNNSLKNTANLITLFEKEISGLKDRISENEVNKKEFERDLLSLSSKITDLEKKVALCCSEQEDNVKKMGTTGIVKLPFNKKNFFLDYDDDNSSSEV